MSHHKTMRSNIHFQTNFLIFFLAANPLPKCHLSQSFESLHLQKNCFEVKRMNVWRPPGLLFLMSKRAISEILFIPQITYFSLWYYNKQNQQRWIDLEKPLKKQLDKYGLEPTVYFGVVFYVSTVTQLQQEITRLRTRVWLKMITLVLLQRFYSLPVFCADISIISSWRRTFWRGRSHAPLSKPFIWPAWLCKVFFFSDNMFGISGIWIHWDIRSDAGLMRRCPCFQMI